MTHKELSNLVLIEASKMLKCINLDWKNWRPLLAVDHRKCFYLAVLWSSQCRI